MTLRVPRRRLRERRTRLAHIYAYDDIGNRLT
jgi:hypothetical protein